MRRLLICLLLLFAASPAFAELRLVGENTIWQDTVWSGEVLIDGVVTVAPGVTLELRPGTTVRFTRLDSNNDQIGEHELFVQGRLLALGTVEQPIVFTSAEAEPVAGDWGALNMMASTTENLLQYTRVEYAYRGLHAHYGRARLDHARFVNNRRGAQFQESAVQIDSTLFSDNLNGLQFRDSTVTVTDSTVRGSYWGIRCVNSQVDMTDTSVENNLVNGINFRASTFNLVRVKIRNNRRGLYLQQSSGSIERSELIGNSEHGMFAEEAKVDVSRSLIAENGRAGIRLLDTDLTLLANQIIDNDLYAVINDGVSDLVVDGNWWGTASRAELDALVRDGHDRPGLGLVKINQPLTTRPAWAE